MMCSKCGAQLNETDTVCPICGEPVQNNNGIITNEESHANNLESVEQSLTEALSSETVVNEPVKVAEEPMVNSMPEAAVMPEATVMPDPTTEVVQELPVVEVTPVAEVAPMPAVEPTIQEVTPAVEMTATTPVQDPAISEPVVQTTQTPEIVTQPVTEETAKKGSKLGIIIAVVAVLLILCGVRLYFFVFAKNTTKTFTSEFERINDVFESNPLFKNQTQKVDMSIKPIVNISSIPADYSELVDNLKKISIDMSVYENPKDTEANSMLQLKYNNKDLLKVSVYVLKEKMYLSMPGLIDSYIDLDLGEEMPSTNTSSVNNLPVMVEEITNAFNSSLKKDYITTEKATVKVDETEKNVTANILVLDGTNEKTLLNDMKAYLKGSNKFKEALIASDEEITSSNVDTYIDGIFKELNFKEKPMKIAIYTEGLFNKVVCYSLEVNNQKYYLFEKEDSLTLTDATYNKVLEVTSKDNKETYTYYISRTDYVGLEINYTESNGSDFKAPDLTKTITMEEAMMGMDTILTKLMSSEGFVELMTDFEPLLDSDLINGLLGLDNSLMGPTE